MANFSKNIGKILSSLSEYTLQLYYTLNCMKRKVHLGQNTVFLWCEPEVFRTAEACAVRRFALPYDRKHTKAAFQERNTLMFPSTVPPEKVNGSVLCLLL